jgi:hypothetical protein
MEHYFFTFVAEQISLIILLRDIYDWMGDAATEKVLADRKRLPTFTLRYVSDSSEKAMWHTY